MWDQEKINYTEETKKNFWSKELEDVYIKLNRDNLKTKEDQLKELKTDYQNHSVKIQQLLWFFAATTAIVFWQETLYQIPWQFLWIIFSLIIWFLVLSLLWLLWKSVEWMITIDETWSNEKKYILSKISYTEEIKNNMLKLIEKQDRYNTYAWIIFMILVVIYAFIFLIYIPMTNNYDEEQGNQQIIADTSSTSSSSGSEPVMWVQTIIKSGDTSSWDGFIQTSNQE
jgi:hypothetical protein